jgi:hypothetical protein
MVFIIPAVLSTKQCYDYVGGSRIWDELIAAHGDILKPIRTVPRGDSFWRRESIDGALCIAEGSRSLIAAPAEPKPGILARQDRRFKTTAA